jgi:hypothetical protein
VRTWNVGEKYPRKQWLSADTIKVFMDGKEN